MSADMLGQLSVALQNLNWDAKDELVVEIGGSSVSGIHQGENYNEKWATPYGVRKYNNDAFIVIKNRSRDPFVPSQAPVDKTTKE
jgi:hypothetical protein